MKIGLMGGTFDPIHTGHRDIALSAKNEYALDELWFMPAGSPYCKACTKVTDAELRLRMTELAVSEMPDFCHVCDIEIRAEGKTYTAETLEELKRLYPKDEFYFIAGADSILYMEDWYEPELIFRDSVVLCAERPGHDEELSAHISMLKERFFPNEDRIRLIHCPKTDISSTMIRDKVRAGEDISTYVSPKVLRFIKENRLYI